MDAPTLLRHVVKELEARVAEPVSEYDALRVAGLLRLLLVDTFPEPLIDTVSRERGRSPVFAVRVKSPAIRMSPSMGSAMTRIMHFGLTPTPASPAFEVDRQAFTQLLVAESSAGPVSVELAIYCASIVFGGVHFDPRPRRPEARTLADIVETFDDDVADGEEQLTQMMVDIARVTLAAAQPLLD